MSNDVFQNFKNVKNPLYYFMKYNVLYYFAFIGQISFPENFLLILYCLFKCHASFKIELKSYLL